MSDPNDRDRQQRELMEELRHDAELRAESRRLKEQTGPPMPTRYEQAALRHARFEHLAPGTYYGEIPGFPGKGVWGMRHPCHLSGGAPIGIRRRHRRPPRARRISLPDI